MLPAEKVTSCFLKTTEDDPQNHEEDQHGTHCSLVDLYKVEPRTLRVDYLVSRPFLVADLLDVLACCLLLVETRWQELAVCCW